MTDTTTDQEKREPTTDERIMAAAEKLGFKGLNSDEFHMAVVQRLEAAAEKYSTSSNQYNKEHWMDVAMICFAILR